MADLDAARAEWKHRTPRPTLPTWSEHAVSKPRLRTPPTAADTAGASTTGWRSERMAEIKEGATWRNTERENEVMTITEIGTDVTDTGGKHHVEVRVEYEETGLPDDENVFSLDLFESVVEDGVLVPEELD